MNIVLIPGFWLDGDSWGEVTTVLREHGHGVTALTLPGLERDDAANAAKPAKPGIDRSTICLRDHVDAVVAAVDASDVPVVLVGHSGGGALAHGAVDARPDRVARVVYVDSGPLAHGGVINDELPAVDGVIPLPDWSVFDEPDLTDLDDAAREHFRSIAHPQPVHVATDALELRDPRRFDVPVTVICCEFPADMLRQFMAEDHPYTAELARIRDRELVDLPTGHWPQFTKPRQLAETILAAL
ncbi:alpha/beta fold hydrolase [Marisediminicola sp. LYQ85]|uniref:alpha/beta fold hydrolase n=1 Tax=Marisediminicola sp. LYQ85 TaxID=3391062 RepID=UPI003982DC59